MENKLCSYQIFAKWFPFWVWQSIGHHQLYCSILFVSERQSYRSAASLSLLWFLATAGTVFALLGAFSISSTVPFPPTSERVTFLLLAIFHAKYVSVPFQYSAFPPGVLFFRVHFPCHALHVFYFFYSFPRAREFSLSPRVSSTVPNYYRLRSPALTRIQSEFPHLRIPSSDSASSEWKILCIISLMRLVASGVLVRSSSASAPCYTFRHPARQSSRLRFVSEINIIVIVHVGVSFHFLPIRNLRTQLWSSSNSLRLSTWGRQQQLSQLFQAGQWSWSGSLRQT